MKLNNVGFENSFDDVNKAFESAFYRTCHVHLWRDKFKGTSVCYGVEQYTLFLQIIDLIIASGFIDEIKNK